MNRISGVAFLDIIQTIRAASDWRQYWWLYAMLFSTILPTGLHVAIALFAVQAVFPLAWRVKISTWIARRDEDLLAAVLAPAALGTMWLVAVAGPLTALYVIAVNFDGAFALAWAHYARWLEQVAMFAGAV